MELAEALEITRLWSTGYYKNQPADKRFIKCITTDEADKNQSFALDADALLFMDVVPFNVVAEQQVQQASPQAFFSPIFTSGRK